MHNFQDQIPSFMKKVILAAMGTVLMLGSAYAQFDDV
jgi:hypothetical protein